VNICQFCSIAVVNNVPFLPEKVTRHIDGLFEEPIDQQSAVRQSGYMFVCEGIDDLDRGLGHRDAGHGVGCEVLLPQQPGEEGLQGSDIALECCRGQGLA